MSKPSLKPSAVGRRPGAIERQVRELQNELWSLRFDRTLWGGTAPTNPIEVLQPGVALRLLGYEIKTVDTLGQITEFGKSSEAAGFVDNNERVVSISARFSPSIQRFTAAHELGHALLHGQAQQTVFRDIPSEGPIVRRDPIEREADQVAYFFLMPSRRVEAEFEARFHQIPFTLTDDMAFALGGMTIDAVLKRAPRRRDLSLLLATAQQFGGRQFNSLADSFGVSSVAMAIRLEELDLC